jgi:hypothetical protein
VNAASASQCARCSTPLEVGDLRCAICGQVAPAATAMVPASASAAVLRCEQCGAAVAFTPEAQGLRCIFCTAVMRLEQPQDPIESAETILPFRVDPATANGALRAWLSTLGFFRPSDLAASARVEALRPLWWAAWIFDAQALVSWTADSDAGSWRSAWAPHAGQTPMDFHAVLVSASRGLDKSECARLAPHFDLRTASPQPQGPAGALLERFDVQRSAARAIVADAVRATAESRLTSGVVPGSRFRNLHVAVLLRGLVTRRVALPTYVLAYRYQGKPYRALVHGQDARCVMGAAPLSVAKIVLVVLLGVLLVGGIIAAIVAYNAYR